MWVHEEQVGYVILVWVYEKQVGYGISATVLIQLTSFKEAE